MLRLAPRALSICRAGILVSNLVAAHISRMLEAGIPASEKRALNRWQRDVNADLADTSFVRDTAVRTGSPHF
jgi:hypothetical protein